MAAAAPYVPLSCAIEVKCVETGAYHNAEIKTVVNGQALVHYETAWRPDEWVVPGRLRKCAPRFDPAKYTPQVGDKVEVQAKTQDSEPYSWWLATIRTARQDLFMINYASFGEEHNEILEKNHIRPLNTHLPLTADDLQRHEIKLPQELWDQVKLDDYSTLSNAGATAITFDAQQRALIVLGSPASLTKADLIAGVLFKHQMDLLKLKQKTIKHQHDLTLLEQRLKDGVVIEFVADKNLLGLVIGANGKNVDRVQNAIRDIVNIRVNSKTGQVTIVAKTQDAANAARAQLEYVEEKYSIPRVHFGRVVGKKFQNIRDLETKSGCRIKPWDERDRKFGGAGSRVRPPKAKKKYNSATAGPGGDHKKAGGNDDDDDDLTDDITGDLEDLSLVGLKETVNMARLLLDAHFRSITELQAAVDEEKALASQVADLALDAGPLDEHGNAATGSGGSGGSGVAPVRGGRRRGGEGKNYRGRGANNNSGGGGHQQQQHQQQQNQHHDNGQQNGGGRGGRGGGNVGRGGGRGGSGAGGGRGGANAGKPQQQQQPQHQGGQQQNGGGGASKQQQQQKDHKQAGGQQQQQSQPQQQQQKKPRNPPQNKGANKPPQNDQKTPAPAAASTGASGATQQLVATPVATPAASAPAPGSIQAAAAAATATAPAS